MPSTVRIALRDTLRTGPFPDALRAAIAASGLSLRSIQQRLAAREITLSVATLSSWQSGQRRPQPTSASAVTGLERVLRLPRGSLARLVDVPGTPRVRRSSVVPWEQVSESAGALRRLLGGFGPDVQDRCRVISQHEFARIDADRALDHCTSTVVIEAVRTADRYLFTYEADPGNSGADITIVAEMNCRVGRVCADRESGTIAAELLFDRMLRPGETHLFRYGYRDRSGFEQDNVTRTLRRAADVYVLGVQFTPPALPVRLYQHQPDDRRPVRTRGGTELFLDPHHVAHTVNRSMRPGVYGITWQWR